MNFAEAMGCIAGVLQFTVAGYALRLNRRFGTTRVGWSLFWAFVLLAVLHLLQSLAQARADTEMGIETEVMYALISLLLLTGLLHLEIVLKERERVEREEQRLRAELQSEVQKKTSYLMRAIEELESETNERRRMESEIETAHPELQMVSHKAEMAQIASRVLQSVGEMLQSVNTAAGLVSDQVKQSRIANVVHVGALIREHADDLGRFMTHDPRGRELPADIAQLAEHLAAEQTNFLKELEFLKESLGKIAALQQDYARLAGAAGPEKNGRLTEDAWPANNVATA